MADHDHHHEGEEEPKAESLIEKISDKIHVQDDSSSSSDDDKKKTEKTSSFKAKVFRLFGREKPVHKVLGGGKGFFLTEFLSDNLIVFP